MFKLKYNVLVFLQIALNVVNAFLLIKVFGISPQTDAYFMLQTIFAAVYLVQFMPVEQFMFFYNDAKVESRESAEKFYNFSLFLAFLTGAVSVAVFFVFPDLIIKIFAYKLDAERALLLKEFISTYRWVLLFAPVNYVCASLLTAEMKIGYPYVISIIPVFFIVLAQVFCHIRGYYDISPLIAAGLAGTILGSVLNFILIKRNFNYKFSFACGHRMAAKYVKNSLMMKFGHNVHNFLFPLITNNFLSAFPAGFVSYFYYGQKIVGVLQNMVTGPSNRILQSKISLSCSLNDIGAVKNDIKYYFKIFSMVFLSSVFITYWLIPYVLPIISSDRINSLDISYIQAIFLSLAVWNLILFIEAPFDMILMSAKNSRIFIYVNALFIFNYSLTLVLFKVKLGINSIFLALISAQLVNLFFYSRKALSMLNSGHKKALRKIIDYSKSRILSPFPWSWPSG